MAQSQGVKLGVPGFKLWLLLDLALRMTLSYLINPSKRYFPQLCNERQHSTKVILRIHRDASAHKILCTYFTLSSVNAADINNNNKSNNIIHCGNKKLVLRFLCAREGYTLDRRNGTFATGFTDRGAKRDSLKDMFWGVYDFLSIA